MGKSRRRQRGMTLIEIMVVITILGLIAAAVGVSVMGQFDTAKRQRAELDFKSLGNALQLYRVKTGHLPSTADGLKALVDARMLTDAPRDPWGQDYVYTLEGGTPVIVSYGADGTPGGDGNDADLSSRDKASTAAR
jgi:general secretion pathway protein G